MTLTEVELTLDSTPTGQLDFFSQGNWYKVVKLGLGRKLKLRTYYAYH